MRWLRPLFRHSAVEQEMDAEFRFHYDQMVDDFLKRGLSLEEARRRARIAFGGMGQIKDDAREARIADCFERGWRGFRLAVRNLAGSLGFTTVAVATLALGIGVNTLLFSLLDQLLLRNLPVQDPQHLIVFHGNFVTPGMYRGNERLMSFSWPKYTDFRDRCPVFSGVAARFAIPSTLEHSGAAENVEAELVSGNYFDVLGVRPAIGRVFTPAENRVSMGERLVVLGYSYWQRRFAGDPAIVGQQVRVNGLPMTVIGVSAAGFHSIDRGSDVDLRVPMAMKDLFTPNWRGLNQRFWAWLNIVARVKPGLSLREAEAGANVTYRQVLQEEAKTLPPTFVRRKEFLNDHLDLLPAAGGMMDRTGDQKAFFLELMAIAGVVLLIACVNLAGLLLARTAARYRELAIRLALGAGRMGVIRQLLTENLLLAVVGGTSGILLAAALARPAARFLISPDTSHLIDAPLDWRVLLFACAVTTFTALTFAVVPLLQMNRMELADILKTESGASSSRGQVRLREAMVVVQLAFCLWLMIGAGLFARSLAQVKSVNLGFTKERLITFQLDPIQSGYKPEQAVVAHRRVSAALAALPGITAVANSDYGVLTGNVNLMNLDIEGYRPPPPDQHATGVRELWITPGYFRALGTQLVAGRDFTPADVQHPVHVAIVNREFVRQYCAGQNPVGRHIGWPGQQQAQFEIIGVVGDQRYDGPTEPAKPFYYLPSEAQLSYYVRTSLPPEKLSAVVPRIVEQQAPGVPIDHLRTMEEFFNSTIGDKSRIAALATFFGVLATLLATIGLYGVMAYTVARRTREIGVRMALGAARADVLRMVIREVGTVIAAGLAVGLPTGLVLARLIRSQLFNVSPMDARTAAVAAAIVSASALLAGFLPARRAMRIDPMRALRWE